MKKIAINGFGRIGRLAFRKIIEDNTFEISAINDLAAVDLLAYLLKFDSTQRDLQRKEMCSGDGFISIDGKKIPVYSEKEASRLPWKELGIDIVLECSGVYNSADKSHAHIDAGAKRVLISAPTEGVPNIVYNVNHQTINPSDTIVSGASCTTNCLAPMAKALNDYRELRTGFMTTIHAYTGDQMLLDGPQRKGNFRRSRAGAINIVPTSSGAAKSIGLVIPELDGKMIGSAQRVPVATGSVTILDATLKDETETVTADGINEAMKAASNESFGYNVEQIVSSDVIGSSYGSIFDSTQTLAQRCGTKIYEVRVVAWYDNEMGYVSQLIRTLSYMAQQ